MLSSLWLWAPPEFSGALQVARSCLGVEDTQPLKYKILRHVPSLASDAENNLTPSAPAKTAKTFSTYPVADFGLVIAPLDSFDLDTCV